MLLPFACRSLSVPTADGLLGATATVSAAALVVQSNTLAFLAAVAASSASDGENVSRALKLLVQHLCTSVPDRAEYRQHAATATIRILGLMTPEARAPALTWLLKFARNVKTGFRAFALDVAAALLLVRAGAKAHPG